MHLCALQQADLGVDLFVSAALLLDPRIIFQVVDAPAVSVVVEERRAKRRRDLVPTRTILRRI